LISWDTICLEAMEGGLGVRDLRKMNEALILKLVWQLAQGGDKLWVVVIRAKYCKGGAYGRLR
jgi:hypothetical protein